MAPPDERRTALSASPDDAKGHGGVKQFARPKGNQHPTKKGHSMFALPTSSTRVRCLSAVLAGLLIAVFATAAAEAAPATSATCTGLLTINFTPGVTTIPGSGSATSDGQTGTMTCLGTLDGHRITGLGSFGAQETYTAGGACLTDRSSGQVAAILPTTGGPVTIVGTLSAHRLALIESIEIDFPQSHFSGTAIDVPTDGTCLLSPLRQVLVSVTGFLSGGS